MGRSNNYKERDGQIDEVIFLKDAKNITWVCYLRFQVRIELILIFVQLMKKKGFFEIQ